jgi:hypothetical protein
MSRRATMFPFSRAPHRTPPYATVRTSRLARDHRSVHRACVTSPSATRCALIRSPGRTVVPTGPPAISLLVRLPRPPPYHGTIPPVPLARSKQELTYIRPPSVRRVRRTPLPLAERRRPPWSPPRRASFPTRPLGCPPTQTSSQGPAEPPRAMHCSGCTAVSPQFEPQRSPPPGTAARRHRSHPDLQNRCESSPR